MISAIYSCMDREDNLIESLSSWIDIPYITEFIVVDWSSKIPLKNNSKIEFWLDKNRIKLYRVNDEHFFSLSKSYNLGFTKTNNNIVLKLDSDYKNINNNWFNYLVFDEKTQLKNYFIVGDWLFSQGLTGFLLVNKTDFMFYNENFTGWGYDDTDLYNRIQEHHKDLKKVIFFDIQNYITHMPHTDFDRTMNYMIKDKMKSEQDNKNLINTKFNISKYNITYQTTNYAELTRIKNESEI